MQAFAVDGGFDYVDLSEYLADEPLLTISDGTASFDGNNLQAPVNGALMMNMPSTSSASEGNDQVLFERCLENLSEVFPGIDSKYVQGLFDTWAQAPRPRTHVDQIDVASHDLTMQILETKTYPREKDRTNELKRKRSQAFNSDDEARLQWKGDRNGEEKKSYFIAA